MVNPEFQRLLELLGPDAENDPRVRGLMAVPGLNPKMTGTAIQLLGGILRQAGIDPDDPRSLPLVRRLPDTGARLGTVINGMLDGPVFCIPEGTASDLENVGLFGLPRWGKTFILMAIALHSMLKGNVCWLFDVEDQLPCLVDAVPEPYKPVTLTPAHLIINIFEPPSDRISLKLWLQVIAFLLRGEVYIRDGAQNLFEASLRKLLKQKGALEGSGRYPSLAETLCYFQSLRLGGSEVRGKAWLESLVNRMTMLVNTYEPTSRVTNSNMLHLLVNKSVIFRFQNMRGVALHFLTTFLLTWLAAYRQSVADVNKVLTLGIDEHHLFRADQSRNDIGGDTLQGLFATGAKRGLRIVLSNQLISKLDEEIFGNLGCRIITRLANPRDIWLIQQSMGLSPAQAKSTTQLEKREVIVSYGNHPTPFKVRVDELSFPAKPDEMTLEKNAEEFLDLVTWSEDSGQKTKPTDAEAISGDALKVFIRIAEVAETIEERCAALGMDRAREVRARRILEAKGYIAEEQITIGNKKKIYKISTKGASWIKQQKELRITVKRYKSGAIHEYLLNQVEKNIGSLNTKFKFQRHSEIAREYGIQPDSVLNLTSGYRAIIEIICTNVDREADILNKERAMPGVDMIIAVAANKKVRKALELALEKNLFQARSDNKPARLVVLDAECLSPKFDWASVFEQP